MSRARATRKYLVTSGHGNMQFGAKPAAQVIKERRDASKGKRKQS